MPSVNTRATRRTLGRLPGDADIWVFVLGDMLIFSAYFAAYLFAGRMGDRELFLRSQQQLSQNLGFCNTLILLTSSLFIALCVQAARLGNFAVASRFLELGGGCGVVFLLLKAFEWHSKIARGLTISTNAFFMHYYVMTGVHAAHILIGLTFLMIIRRELRDATTPRMQLIESGGIYWHMVDFLWFMIFSLLYLMR